MRRSVLDLCCWQDAAPVPKPATLIESIGLTKLSAGALLATQSWIQYDALPARGGPERLVRMVERLDEGRDTQDLFLAVEHLSHDHALK